MTWLEASVLAEWRIAALAIGGFLVAYAWVAMAATPADAPTLPPATPTTTSTGPTWTPATVAPPVTTEVTHG